MNKKSREHLRQTLAKNPSCYVLVTCGEPTEDGQIQVEMTYEGDALLASYLLQGAQSYIDEEFQEPLDCQTQNSLRLIKSS